MLNERYRYQYMLLSRFLRTDKFLTPNKNDTLCRVLKIIVVPYENDLARKARIEIESIGGQIIPLANLLSKLGNN